MPGFSGKSRIAEIGRNTQRNQKITTDLNFKKVCKKESTFRFDSKAAELANAKDCNQPLYRQVNNCSTIYRQCYEDYRRFSPEQPADRAQRNFCDLLNPRSNGNSVSRIRLTIEIRAVSCVVCLPLIAPYNCSFSRSTCARKSAPFTFSLGFICAAGFGVVQNGRISKTATLFVWIRGCPAVSVIARYYLL